MPAAVSRRFLGIAVLLLLPACDRVTTISPPDPDVFPAGDPILGRVAFEAECAGCHAAGDGFDLAFFGFGAPRVMDEAKVRVDSASALDIVAYINSLDVPASPRGTRPFQPGETVLSSDVEFAQRAFGGDRIPADLTSEDLLSLDPLQLPVAVAFPLWSDRRGNVHWMPESPLDLELGNHDDGDVRAALDDYYRHRSDDALIEAVEALRAAERDVESDVAPCVASPISRLEAGRCFETRRWVASLGAQFLLRAGEADFFDRAVHDSWWDVGNAARLSLRTQEPVEDALQSWVRWMYLGWAFEPARHSSVYLASGLHEVELPRHAAFHALRSMVARGEDSRVPYEDVSNTARYAPDAWVFGAVSFGYRHLLERLERNDRPKKGDAREAAIYQTLLSYQIAAGRIIDPAERQILRDFRDEILDRLD